MNVRIVIPLKWESEFRKTLFDTLKNLGYTWSKGDSLDSDYPNLHKIAYIAINPKTIKCSFSSKLDIARKPETDFGYNYLMDNHNIDKILEVINFFKNYLLEEPDERKIINYIFSHHDLMKLYKTL